MDTNVILWEPKTGSIFWNEIVSLENDSCLIFKDLGFRGKMHAICFLTHGSLRCSYKIIEKGLEPMKNVSGMRASSLRGTSYEIKNHCFSLLM